MNRLRELESIAIFGAGFIGRKLHDHCRKHGLRVAFFLDNHRAGSSLDGVPVVAPDDVSAASLRDRIPAILSVRNSAFDPSAVREQLMRCGWRKILSFAEFNRQFRDDLGDLFWGTPPGYYDTRAEEIARVSDIWADGKSKRIYRSLAEFRRTLDDRVLPKPDGDLYFPSDIPRWSEPLRFVDGGAFHGDTLASVVGRGLRVEAAAAFEPDPKNFGQLQDWISTAAPKFPVLCWPCGLFSDERVLSFRVTGALNSRLADDGDLAVKCVSLDAALRGFRPTLIKLDVEGAEMAVLAGARKILEQDRPGWAICVYHRADDLWRVPTWLVEHARKPGYDFYLRAHAHEGEDTVLYAVPRA